MNPNVIEGNILDIEEGIICHQVNCQGVMGAGLAKQIKEKYPLAYKDYKDGADRYGKSLLGLSSICVISPKLWIVHLYGQIDFGRSKNKVYTCYESLSSAVDDLFGQIETHNWNTREEPEYEHFAPSSVYMPYMIGCGLGGGNWNTVLKHLEPWLDRITFVRLPT